MAIFDQHELESRVSYSGSYTSDLVLGTILGTKVGVSASIYNAQRTIVGSKIDGFLSASATNTFQKWQLSTWFNLKNARQSAGVVNHTFISSDETYLDSMMPDILTIAATNADYIFSSSLGITGDADLGLRGFPAGTGAMVVLRKTSPWFQEFPFQTKHKNSVRLLRQGRKLLFVTASMTDLVGIAFEDSDGVATFPLDISSSIPHTDFLVGNISDQFDIADSANKLLPLSIEEIKKSFFGIGDGLNLRLNTATTYPRYKYMPKWLYVLLPTNQFLAGPVYRGFKFGILNANPINPSFAFRHNHYGHFRDILEQPKYSAFFLANGTVNFPVSIQFLSGTSIAASASVYQSSSTPTSFNAKDSGIYDFHYRAGQPFFDT